MPLKLLHPLIRNGNGPPFFVVPSAGMTRYSLVRLSRVLGRQWPLYAFEFAGMSNELTPHTSVEEMAADFVDEILNVRKSGPYYLGGHCFGGVVALEIARVLEGMGAEVPVLALLETIPPQLLGEAIGPTDTNDQEQSDAAVASEIMAALNSIFEQSRRKLALLQPDLAVRFGLLYQQQIELGFHYRASPIKGAIVQLRTQTHADKIFEAWRELSLTRFSEHLVPGNAFSILSPPDVAALGEQLRDVLAAAAISGSQAER